jgi:hypothetical protein
MKLYSCTNCHSPLYFENNICLTCQHPVGFDPDRLEMVTLEGANQYTDFADKKTSYSYCQNAALATCNWLVPQTTTPTFCPACALNRTIPALVGDNIGRWSRIEMAKHRLVYSLLRLNIPVKAKVDEEEEGIAFDFLADESNEPRVLTGHANGTITLNIEEADEDKRAKNKQDLGEKYRTLLGHFRHEIGHYYWEVLIKDSPFLEEYRAIFGDEQKDYGEALEAYYQKGADPNWLENYISPYATSHSWEDWAESWAHYLHLMDTLETAFSFGIGINPKQVNEPEMQANIRKDPYVIENFDTIIAMWLPLTFAVNSLNRSMGHQDFYPFVIFPSVIKKLKFIHKVCGMNRFKKK